MEQNTSSTLVSDLYVIAYLICIGSKYNRIERPSVGRKGKTVFHFPGEVQKLIDEYFNGQECSAIAFKNAIENVKSLLFDFK